jgi:hypothetical protein
MKCEILLTTKEGQIVVGTVVLTDSKKVYSEAVDEEYETLMKNVLADPHTINGELVSAREDSRAWFKTLPQHYSGMYLRARFV